MKDSKPGPLSTTNLTPPRVAPREPVSAPPVEVSSRPAEVPPSSSEVSEANTVSAPPSPPLENGMPPKVDMSATSEMQKWLKRLEEAETRLGHRNYKVYALFFVSMVLLLSLLFWIHHSTVGQYAVLRDIYITQNPCNQGQVEIKFEVVRPGKVYCRRVSGSQKAELIDNYKECGVYSRPWSWSYRPGSAINLLLWSRSWFLPVYTEASFPTSDTLDTVFIIDTTGSMDRSISALKEKCVEFADKLRLQDIHSRYALLGFGDVQEDSWLDRYDFTDSIAMFQRNVSRLKRYDGGDLEESALDALEKALQLPYADGAMKRFYLITDEGFHPETKSGLTADMLKKQLHEKGVLLHVFSRPEHREVYETLMNETDTFLEIENFGKVLSEARVLED